MKIKTHVILIIMSLLVYFSGLRTANAFYDPGMQRWLNRDPIEQLGGVNLYAFTLNTPLMFLDYLGLEGLSNPVLPPNYQYPLYGPLSIPTTMPSGTPTLPPIEPVIRPIIPPSAPPSNKPGSPGNTTQGACGALAIAGGFFNSGSECRARNQALSGCAKTPHSLSGCSSCCVATLTRLQNGPDSYYYTGGTGFVSDRPCSQVKDEGGISQKGSTTYYNPW